MTVNNSTKINIVFMAHLSYPHGMAGTKNIQNSIDYLKQDDNIDIKVLVLRQERVKLAASELSGRYKGVEYVTIGSDIKPNIAALPKSIKYFYQGLAYLKKHYNSQQKNIVHVYGYPSTDNILFILYGKMLGYKFIFYIVEDIAFQSSSPDILAKVKNVSAAWLFRRIGFFADTVLVISKHLYQKTMDIAGGKFPVRLHPVSVNFKDFNGELSGFHDPVRLLYAGTFAEKDGVETLISAFNCVCSRHDNVALTLTGKGQPGRMEIIKRLISQSPYEDRIVYRGYLEDADFYSLLNESDILCMTRTSSAFANAGFPFKLGEYLATGRAVIASDVSDISEFLEDKKSAMIVEPDSVEAIVEAMEFLLTHPDTAKQIGAAGRAVAVESFNMETLGKKLHQVLMEI